MLDSRHYPGKKEEKRLLVGPRMKSFANGILKRAGWITAFALILSAVGLHYSILLYQNLRTDIEELLPTTARSVIDLNEVTRRLESIDNLAILIFSKDSSASRRFVDDLAARLKAAPPGTFASIEYKIDQELKFFEDRRSLYMDLSDLTLVRNYIHDRIDYERALYNPLNIFESTEIQEPILDFSRMRKKYDGRASAYSRFPGGYYSTPDGTKRVVLAYMPGKGSGLDGALRLKRFTEESIHALDPKSYAPDLEIHFTGGVEDRIEEQLALVADLELSTAVVTVVVSLAMWFFFRGFRATAALLISLFMGTLWTFGAAYFAVGYLNANSAFLGSIVIGNGINCGIIFLARYLEERRRGVDHAGATQLSLSGTALSTLTASLAAGLAYGSLYFTEFRGFKQFGVIGLLGMVLCWISAYTVLPALLTVFEKWKPVMSASRPAPKGWIIIGITRVIEKFPRVVLIGTVAITAAALLMIPRYSKDLLETDLGKLRNKVSIERGSAYLSRYVDEIFHRYLSPLVILPDTREDARKIAIALKAKKAEEGERSLIASVQTLDDFIPKDQPQKIKLLGEIRDLLPPRILQRLGPNERKLALEFLRPSAFHLIRTLDLPGLALDKFTEKDGSVGKMVLVEPPLTNETRDGDRLIAFIHELRGVADSVAPGSPVAGSLPISSDMIEAITRDGPKATLFAFIAVVVLVIILFHSPKPIVLVLFSLILGVVWLGGLILGFQLKINFLNFIALPITFGIGVDYGVNIFQRYRQEGNSGILRVIRETGGAVALCSFSTIVGYGSLLIADNQAFVSFGRLAVLGEITCVTAAIIALPALLLSFARKASRKLAPEKSVTQEANLV